jgi:MYND finger
VFSLLILSNKSQQQLQVANDMTTTADSCHVCGKTSSLMNCKRCKSVSYCSADCQRREWKDHEPNCIRKEFAGAPCDCCGTTEDVESGHVCFDCGFLYCAVCSQKRRIHNLSGDIVNFEPCPRCNTRRDATCPRDRKKLEKLIKESPRDPRLANWHVALGIIIAHLDKTRRENKRRKSTTCVQENSVLVEAMP